ncbi:tryptophan halogenase family protein [Paraglaciecola sp. L3A3]|uniref:tryptophan halogenase family protein n=1 Tax=Paraglaciecola sp. L3A3 TaxID=2686358 RepID=UPI00131CF45C|nr:tryptophan halogenase family protein [Paraglaciecola sp. L3A3]
MNKENIVIVGGGTAGWITASVLAKALPKESYSISLIESSDIPAVGVGEATIPPIVNLLSYLEIEQQDLVKQLNATFKYGIHFQDWHQINASYMHAFGLVGSSYQDSTFTDLWLQFREELDLPPLNAFSPTALAAYSNKFNPPHTLPLNHNASDYYPLAGLFYAFHFDASLLATLLKTFAVDNDVKHINGTVKSVSLDQAGEIQSLILSDGQYINGQLFVDCSGTRGLLNKHALKVPFISYKQYLPCDSAIAIQTQSDEVPVPYTRSTAMKNGWRWQIPLQNRRGNGYVYASEFSTYEQTLSELERALEKEKIITDAKEIKFDTGHLKQPWFKNSIAIGLSSGFFEPLESTSIHMIQKHAFALKDALLSPANKELIKDKFNKEYQQDAEEIRDFLLMHYCTTKRNDSEFWRYCQQMEIPHSLHNKLQQYDTTGQITLSNGCIFPYQSWLQVLTGQNVFPSNLSQKNKACSKEQALAFFQSVNQSIGAQVNILPSHAEYLQTLME